MNNFFKEMITERIIDTMPYLLQCVNFYKLVKNLRKMCLICLRIYEHIMIYENRLPPLNEWALI